MGVSISTSLCSVFPSLRLSTPQKVSISALPLPHFYIVYFFFQSFTTCSSVSFFASFCMTPFSLRLKKHNHLSFRSCLFPSRSLARFLNRPPSCRLKDHLFSKEIPRERVERERESRRRRRRPSTRLEFRNKESTTRTR